MHGLLPVLGFPLLEVQLDLTTTYFTIENIPQGISSFPEISEEMEIQV